MLMRCQFQPAHLNVSKATSVASQNIAINLADQPLGGFIVEAKGEAVSVGRMIFNVTVADASVTTVVTHVSDIDNVALYDENGAIVAGPVNAADTATATYNYGIITFTDTVTFPVGIHTYSLKGKLTTTTTAGFESNDTIIASTTPASQWTIVKGQTTGVTIIPAGGTITASTMTVKAGALTVSTQSVPLAQTVIAGVSQFLFANYILDARKFRRRYIVEFHGIRV